MIQDVPAVFEGIVEVNETYPGGQMKTRRQKERLKLGKNCKVLARLNNQSLVSCAVRARFGQK